MDLLDPADVERVVSWVIRNEFRRVALQFPDELLAAAPAAFVRLKQELPGRNIFLLGDSQYGSGSIDEVGAQHYGADCIVKLGPSDQQHGGSMPVLFVFGKAKLEGVIGSGTVASLASDLFEHFNCSEGPVSLVLFCDATLQHLIGSLVDSFRQALLDTGRHKAMNIFVASPDLELSRDAKVLARRRDWRFGVLPSEAWWSILGPVVAAALARPEPWRVCGRGVHSASLSSEEQDVCIRAPTNCGILTVGVMDPALERRLLLRHGHAHPVWRLEQGGAGAVTRLSSDQILLQRYRFVELAKSAAVFGLLLCSTGALQGQAVADRLEVLLRRAGRRVYRFLIGRPSTEKLGNFPEVECYVSLASSEHFPFNSRDFHVPIASPYEVEVALGSREWSGDYIADLEELLAAPLPIGSTSEELVAVQSLGAKGQVRCFSNDTSLARPGAGSKPRTNFFTVEPRPPAMVEAGLHGVPSHYVSEPESAAAATVSAAAAA